MVPPRPRTYAGGAQRGVSLATGTFTGEARRSPLGGYHLSKLQYINYLPIHDLGVLDSFAESTKSTWWNPLDQTHPAKSSDRARLNASQERHKRRCAPRGDVVCATDLPGRVVHSVQPRGVNHLFNERPGDQFGRFILKLIVAQADRPVGCRSFHAASCHFLAGTVRSYLAVFLHRGHGQPKFLAQCSGHEATDAVCFPAGGGNDRFDCRAFR